MPSDDFGLVVPGSATDFAKALREFTKSLGDIGKFIGSAGTIYQRHKARVAAKGFATLAFEKGVMRRIVERIAKGTGGSGDFDALAQGLQNTAIEVEDAIESIFRYKDRIREQFGLEVGMKLDEMMNGESEILIGKRIIRHHLETMVAASRRPDFDPRSLQSDAQWVLSSIDKLNKELIQLHDLVLASKRPRGAPRKRKAV
jgi:hypothetical protein